MCQNWFEATSYSLCASQWLSCDGSQRLRCRSQTPHSCALRTMDGELGHTTTSTREGCMGQRRRGWGSECCDSHSHTLRCHLCDGEMLHHSLCAHCTAQKGCHTQPHSGFKGLRPKYTTALLFSASIFVFFRPTAAASEENAM